jgi:hypothetical protein
MGRQNDYEVGAMPTTIPPRTLTIAARFNGPLTSANGGYACGLLARYAAPDIGPHASVTLHTPPPLGTPIELSRKGSRVHAWAGDELIATVAASAPDRMDRLEPVSVQAAQDAAARFTGHQGHPFPTCFVCGVDRQDSSGLFLSPGPMPSSPGTVACTWTPDESVLSPAGAVPDEIVWSVLDCPGGWTGDPAREPMVLGRMAARILAPLRPHQQYVVVGSAAGRQGRTATKDTALFDADGALVAQAAAIWVAVNA